MKEKEKSNVQGVTGTKKKTHGNCKTSTRLARFTIDRENEK